MEAHSVRITPDQPPARSIIRILAIIVAAAILLAMIWILRKPLGWIFIAGFLAIAMSGPVNILSRYMKRGLAIAAVYIGLLLVPFAALALIVPPIVEQVENLVKNAPEYARDVTTFVNENERLRELNEKYDLTAELNEQARKVAGRVGDVAGLLGDIGLGLINSIFAGVTILTLSIFIIGGGPRWRQAFIRNQPEDRGRALNRMFDRIANSTGNYVQGALIQAFIAAVAAFIVLSILGVPYPAALSVVVFLADLIPLVGATLGAILVGVVTVFTDFPTATIIWTIYSIIYQQVENNVIQPRIQARAVALEPFLVVVAVLFGGSLFGIVGALVAVPVAAALQIAVRDYLAFRRGEFDDPRDDEWPSPPAGALEDEDPPLAPA